MVACAIGTPLVCAAWLLDSAKAGSVLPLDGYRVNIDRPDSRFYEQAIARALARADAAAAARAAAARALARADDAAEREVEREAELSTAPRHESALPALPPLLPLLAQMLRCRA